MTFIRRKAESAFSETGALPGSGSEMIGIDRPEQGLRPFGVSGKYIERYKKILS